MSKLIKDINTDVLASAYIEILPFGKGKSMLEKEGYKIISLEENAKLRIQEGKGAYISNNANWVREGIIYTKNGVYLTRNSPVLTDIKTITSIPTQAEEFYITKKQIEKSLEDSVEIKPIAIPTNRFKDDPITVFAFDDIAEQYGLFLKEIGIKKMSIELHTLEAKPFATLVWFCSSNKYQSSNLIGNWHLIHERIRGIKKLKK
ncbi:MAG: hypothetical protein PHD81_03850 [Candidatus Nanoarchaeia archaeon]|nr:hypothetical protein [Candidatus Nanoarchaeia archaeon]MDD5588216.1 hypothetical protein [Candidatus Nanoarchaeia archaeon]